MLTGTHPEAPPDLRSLVAELVAEVRCLHERVDQLEEKSQEDPQELGEEVKEILKQMNVSWEAATLEQLCQIAKALRIRVSRSATQEQLRQQLQSRPSR